eukprot:scaffold26626_cov178-Skeletonema_menzelii.AAC.7
MSYTEMKKRRLDQLCADRDHKPSKQQVVKLLIGGDEKITESPHPTNDSFIICSAPCPKEGHTNCKIEWKKNTGFTNPFSKLCTCFGGAHAVNDAYWYAYDAKVRGESGDDIRHAMNWIAGYTPEENGAFDWLRMIVKKNWPLTSVEDADHRSVIKHTQKFSYKRMAMLLLLLGEIVEEKITEQLKNSHAVAIYDGFTRSGTHYMALYVSYILNEGKGKEEGERLEINLLACSPMPATAEEEELIPSGDDDDDDDEPHYAAKFDADTMRNFIQNVLQQYGHTIDSLLIAFLADNTEVNRKLARDADLPHIPCLNHTVALDVGEMKKAGSQVTAHHEIIKDVLMQVKRSSVQVGILQQITNIRCATVNSCKWTSMASDLNRFDKLWDALSTMVTNERSTVEFDTSAPFRQMNKRFSNHMNTIASLHGKLQEQGLTRYKGQAYIDTTMAAINEHKNTPRHPLYCCEWKNAHSRRGNKHETNKFFCSGLHKIQTGKERTLNLIEKDACQWLLKVNHPAYKVNNDDNASGEDATPTATESDDFNFADLLTSSAESAALEKEATESEYVNTDHLLASAAIVECLWSKFDALVPQRREGMSPLLIEAILFLKENCDLWSIEDIREALRRVKANEKAQRTEEKLRQLK